MLSIMRPSPRGALLGTIDAPWTRSQQALPGCAARRQGGQLRGLAGRCRPFGMRSAQDAVLGESGRGEGRSGTWTGGVLAPVRDRLVEDVVNALSGCSVVVLGGRA